jgi:hypothetical protein
MPVLAGRQIIRSAGVALVVAPVLAVAACQSGAGTTAAGSAAPSSASVSPSAAATPVGEQPAPSTTAVVAVRTVPSRARPTSTAPHLLPDGKSQAFVLAIDATHRIATIRPMKMVSCVGESTCEDDYKIKITGPTTRIVIASGATVAAAQDDSGTVCDANAPAKSCARSITQFAGMAQQYQRKADLVIRRGAVVTVNEIFTP